MKSYDYEAVAYDGAIYCVDCLPEGIDVDSDEDEVSPLFADSEHETTPVCDKCKHVHDYVSIIYGGKDEDLGNFYRLDEKTFFEASLDGIQEYYAWDMHREHYLWRDKGKVTPERFAEIYDDLDRVEWCDLPCFLRDLINMQ